MERDAPVFVGQGLVPCQCFSLADAWRPLVDAMDVVDGTVCHWMPGRAGPLRGNRPGLAYRAWFASGDSPANRMTLYLSVNGLPGCSTIGSRPG